MPVKDLETYRYFVSVVAHGGYTAASMQLGVPRSKLSVRIQKLEDELGTRLIERSTRNFRVSDLGMLFYQRCLDVLQAADLARDVIIHAQSRPIGMVRLGVPLAFVDLVVTKNLLGFLDKYPDVSVQVVGTDRNSDLVGERIDVEIRTGLEHETQKTIVMRQLGSSSLVIVASTKLLDKRPINSLTDLEDAPFLTATTLHGEDSVLLNSSDGKTALLRKKVRFACRSMPAVLAALGAGLGVAVMPAVACREELETGRLMPVLSDWRVKDEQVYLAFPTRRGLTPAARALVDYLVETSNLHKPGIL